MKLEQVQVPQINHNTPDSIEGNPMRDKSKNTRISNSDCSNHNHNRNNHPSKPSDFGISDDRKCVYNPGGKNINTEDGPTRDDSHSSSTSSGNASCATNTSPTNTHRTDALAPSFEATGDDENFAQHARVRRDHHLPV